MADLVAITNALAAQITQYTGLRALGQARDQITPPCAVVLPGRAGPFLLYGTTMSPPFEVCAMSLPSRATVTSSRTAGGWVIHGISCPAYSVRSGALVPRGTAEEAAISAADLTASLSTGSPYACLQTSPTTG